MAENKTTITAEASPSRWRDLGQHGGKRKVMEKERTTRNRGPIPTPSQHTQIRRDRIVNHSSNNHKSSQNPS